MSQSSLATQYDVAMLDLDGVVYIGGAAVPHAPMHLGRAREVGLRLAFITNNAARPPAVVADHLASLGVPAAISDVVTSAQAAAGMLARRFESGSHVLLLGGAGLEEALRERGLEPVTDAADPDLVAVASGYGPKVTWRDIMEAAVTIRSGVPWVASNTDLTIPTPRGFGPGHGALVQLLRDFAGVEPDIAGKPAPPLLEETIARTGAAHPLMVGDRLDTDIEGGRAVGVDTLLVMTGVTDVPTLVAAPEQLRPTYVAGDLGGLLREPDAPQRAGEGWACGGWRAGYESDSMRVSGSGHCDAWYTVVAAAGWHYLDQHGSPIDVTGLVLPDPVTR